MVILAAMAVREGESGGQWATVLVQSTSSPTRDRRRAEKAIGTSDGRVAWGKGTIVQWQWWTGRAVWLEYYHLRGDRNQLLGSGLGL